MGKTGQEAALTYQQELEQENADLKTALALLRQDQQAGYHVQQSLLPANPTLLNHYRLDYWLRPSLYLSGDFVDCWPVSEHQLLFYLADVSGHGASSAFVTILIKYLLGKYCEEEGFSPAALCTRINQELVQGALDKHLTLVLGCLDTRKAELTYALGAHLPVPLMLNADGQIKPLEGSGMPVGLFPDAHYQNFSCPFPAGGTLCMASDGVLEVMPGQGLEERQANWQQYVLDAGGNLEQLVKQLKEGTGHWPDDVTLMTLTGY